MRVIVTDEAELASATAVAIAAQLEQALAERPTASIAFSGGRTPTSMFRELARKPVPWEKVHVFQVDERVADAGDPERNLTSLATELIEPCAIPPDRVHPVPVEAAGMDAESAAEHYRGQLADVLGTPPVIDVVQLGLGEDGHTASLVPGDAVLEVTDCDVAATGTYQAHRRVTLTFPMIARARRRVWMVAGAGKAAMVARLVAADATIPPGRVPREGSMLLVDGPAASRIDPGAHASVRVDDTRSDVRSR